MALALVALCALLAAGCKVTGGGYIASATGDGKATFGFVGSSKNGTSLSGTWHDGPVKLRFTAVDVAFPPSDCYSAYARYESTSPAQRGDGMLTVYACDDGEPGTSDEIGIEVTWGPYTGYTNDGELLGGNVQAHD